jgi:superfamily I DNA/RNA helicase
MTATPARTWSPQQQAIFAWAKTGRGNLVVRARAGTGKTTTVLEAVQYAPETGILFAAFNTRIASELAARLTDGRAAAKTLHSVGFAIVRKYWAKITVEKDRGQRLATTAAPGAPAKVVTLVKKLASVAKGALPFPTEDGMVELAYQFDCDPDEEMVEDGWTVNDVARAAIAAMKLAQTYDGEIDFDDMIYLPISIGWTKGTYSLVIVDEAQDMNQAQLLLAQRVCKRGGRILVVGDDRQAIYGFRGADSNAIDRMKGELRAAELPLNTTYRCGKAIVAEAAKLVPDFTAAPTAPEGSVSEMFYDKMLQAAQPGCFILSRLNAPLVGTAMRLLKAGKRARIEGRDIAAGLLGMMRKVGYHGSVPEFIGRLTTFVARAEARLLKAGPKAQNKLDHLRDQADTLLTLAADAKSMGTMEASINHLFAEGVNDAEVIVLSSVHKAKGLERETVYILQDSFYRWSRDQEEDNLMYVAVTRAKTSLVRVSGGVVSRRGGE